GRRHRAGVLAKTAGAAVVSLPSIVIVFAVAVALYAGGAVALAVGLALASGLPGWAAALLTAALLGVVAYALRGAAHGRHAPHPPHRVVGGAAPAAPPTGLGMPYPPMPQNPPDVPHHRA
ncbi:hypothetical protein ACWCQV_11095, partial [Streptomyces eurythermus]